MQALNLQDASKFAKSTLRHLVEFRTPKTIAMFKLGASLLAVAVAVHELISLREDVAGEDGPEESDDSE